MSPYSPGIYIRDYTITDDRIFALDGEFILEGKDAAFRRELLLKAEVPPAEVGVALSGDADGELLLSGDAQSGDDVLLLQDGSRFRLRGGTMQFITSSVDGLSPGVFILTGQPARFLASYRIAADAGSFEMTGNEAQFRRALVWRAEPGTFLLSGNDATFLDASIIQALPGEFVLTVNEAAFRAEFILRADAGSFALVGNEARMVRHLRIKAEPGSFVMTGQDASFSTQANLLLLSGDAQSGSDGLALSGDAQSGSNLLLFTET